MNIGPENAQRLDTLISNLKAQIELSNPDTTPHFMLLVQLKELAEIIRGEKPAS